jgi:tryptophan-rich sensory protein
MATEVTDVLKLVASIAIPGVAALLGALVTTPNVRTWYPRVRKPSWSPPNWLFGPVWTLLYLLMGVALYLVWRLGWENPDVRVALILFGAQLALNVLWSVIFFGWHRLGWALLEIAALWVLILLTLIQFYRLQPVAGLLLVPYLLWVTFATILNGTVWSLNRSQNYGG